MRETAVKQLSATPLNSTSQSQWLSTTRLNRISQGQTYYGSAHTGHMAREKVVNTEGLRQIHTEHRFRHLPPNSSRFGYATEGTLFISA